MRCPKCRSLTLDPAMEAHKPGRLVRCPRCPAIWLAGPHEAGSDAPWMPPPLTRRGPLVIEGEILPGAGAVREPRAPSTVRPRFQVRRYGIAAGAVVLVMALTAVVLLAPDVSALPGLALLEGTR